MRQLILVISLALSLAGCVCPAGEHQVEQDALRGNDAQAETNDSQTTKRLVKVCGVVMHIDDAGVFNETDQSVLCHMVLR